MKRRVLTQGFLIAVFISTWGQARLYSQDCGIDVNVSMSKGIYQADELLEANVVFDNRNRGTQGVILRYPTFVGLAEGLAFTPMGAIKRSTNLPQDLSGVFGTIGLPPGKSMIRVYLQRFLDGFSPGHYEIPWSLRVACSELTRLNVIGYASARGLLRFDVAQNQNTAPSDLYEGYLQQSQTLRDPADPFRKDAAIEALVLTKSPAVIPYLLRVATLGIDRQAACNALVKFPVDPAVRLFIHQSLRSNELVYECGVKVLVALKERLPSTEVQELLSEENRAIRLATLSYINFMPDPSYRPLVEAHIEDRDPEIAKAATAARAALMRQ